MTRTVLITGTSSGFGHATARHFAKQGWNVLATMRDPSAAKLEAGDNVLVTRLDVTDSASIAAAIEAGVARFGQIDVVINNAGYGQYGVFEGVPAEKIQQNFDVNLFGVMNVMRAILPIYRRQAGGMIINVSSVGGLVGLPAAAIYLSTKFALEGFTEAVSRAAAEDVKAGGIPAYAAFITRTNEVMSELGKNLAPAERIASVIFGAATDGTRRLRYLAGDDVQHLVDARRKLGDPEYEDYMRAQLT